MSRHIKLAVVLPGAVSYATKVCDGICDALAKYPDWIIRTDSSTEFERTVRWQPDALIIDLITPNDLEQIKTLTIPVVNYSGVMRNSGVTTVRIDDVAVGTLAAKYMLELGLKNFAYWGAYNSSFAYNRFQGFREKLLAESVPEDCIYSEDFSTLMDWRDRDKRMAHWLRGLPKPLGLFAMTDQQAYYISEIASEIGIDIPNQLALLGVDNDPIYTKLCRPRLSSVLCPAFQVGSKSVELIAEMLNNPKLIKHPKTILMPPVSVVKRGSTDMLAIEDDTLKEVIKFIRQKACEISVEDILSHVNISRSNLEKKFKLAFGRSPGAEIRKNRIETAKTLLASTLMPISQIATECGFCDSQYLSKVFMREVNMLPSDFRRSYSTAMKLFR